MSATSSKPPADLRARVLAAARATPAPPRAAVRTRAVALAAGAAVALASIFFYFGGVRPTGRPVALMVLTALGAAALGGAAAWVVLGRGGSMLGRPQRWLLATGLFTPVALFAWKLGTSALFAGMTNAWPERPGLKCLGLSLATGVWPLVAGLVARRGAGGDPLRPALTGAALGLVAGALAWVAVDLWCPVAYVPHLALGHLLPLALLTGLGALAGARALAVRA
jgi:hypothetical protein